MFCFCFNRLLIRTGSWFWPQVAPPALLWPGGWLVGQLLIAAYPSNPQPKTDYHQHFSTFGMKPVVTSDFMGLGPVDMPNQLGGHLTGFLAWRFGWLRLQTSRAEALLNTGSTPKHSVNTCWQNGGMSGWQKTSQLCQRCPCDCVQTQSMEKLCCCAGVPPQPPKVYHLRETFLHRIRIQGVCSLISEGGKTPNCQA